MTTPCTQGAEASTDSANQPPATQPPASSCPLPPSSDSANGSANGPTNGSAHGPTNGQPEPVRHLLFGSLSAVRATIHHLHHLSYAEPNDWSQPIPAGRPNEVMAILIKRVRLE
ncbi:MAG: hypothetical protein WBD47_06065 [Phormidesmis sp.]